MNSITDYLNQLTDEEKTLHAELIAECILREKEVSQCMNATRHNIMHLESILLRHETDLMRINHALRDLASTCREIRDRESTRLLSSIPDEKFHCA